MRQGLLLFATIVFTRAAQIEPDAVLVITGDQHSAYARTAQFVARVDRIRSEHPTVPLAILIDGDALEYGNAVARRSHGAIDFGMFRALAQRAPTILNLGNHEPEFYDMADTVQRIEATGVHVVSNIVNRATGQPFAPAETKLRFGTHEAVVVGVVTDHLTTFRLAVRPQLDLADPVVWARKNFPTLLREAPVRIVLSHAGVRADREMLPLVPDGTLFAGAHDHLRFVHREGRTVYVHSGSWNEFMTVAWLQHDGSWRVEQVPIATMDPADSKIAELIRATAQQWSLPEDVALVGRTSRELAPAEAARFAVRAVREAAGVDAALIGNTTFGAGLPAGNVTRIAFDACIRFDGTIFVGEIDGARLHDLLAMANQGPDTPWSERRGEFLYADGVAAPTAGKKYRIAVTDWVARNAKNYLGSDPITLEEWPQMKLKAIVESALKSAVK